ncbi:MAG: hypothetical protein HQ530_03105 [Parcubacteria group bacterium]|nr:hypothetical protein [Parcubacteria group bacterium]
MLQKKINTPKIIPTVIACLLVVLLAAFGCKKDEEAPATTDEVVTNSPDEEVTFTSPSLDTESTTDTNTTDEGQDTEETATDTNTTETNTTEESTNATISTNETNLSTTDTQSSSTEESQVLKLAETLAEIYGTYTNKDKQPFKNLQDIKPYASQKMAAWIDGKTSGSASTTSDGAFYGITTKALSSAAIDSGSTSYKVLVTCQQEEITEVTQSPQKDYQLLEMYFVKESKEWKLDGAFWK